MRWIMIVAIMTATPASAFTTGNKLHEMCRSDDNVEWGVCAGLVIGFIQGLKSAEDMAASDGFTPQQEGIITGFCIPDTAKEMQAVDVVTNWLKDHPEQRHHSGAFAVWTAMIEAFPCPSESGEWRD